MKPQPRCVSQTPAGPLTHGSASLSNLRRGETRVEFANKTEPALLQCVTLARFHIRQCRIAIHLQHGSLKLRRQITAAEHAHAAVRHRRTTALQHHEARQILILGAKPVARPRTCARMAGERKTRVHHVAALRVLVHLRGHRANHREVVREFRKLRKQFGDHGAALPARPRLPRTGHNISDVIEHGRFHRHRHGLPVTLLQLRLRIKRVEMRHAAAHVGEDDVLGARLEMRPTHHPCRCRRAKNLFRQ